MKPSPKDPQLEAFISILDFDRKTKIEAYLCVACNKPALLFSDKLSKLEFSISGLCQDCQNDVFGKKEEEEL
jgi:protein-arginine kinase activator protein McsA